MSESKLDLSFLSSLNDDKPKTDIQKKLLLETAMGMVGELETMVTKMDANLYLGINKKLATGNCFVKDEILFIREHDGKELPVWFPKGNALEYQRDHGLISKKTADAIIPAAEKLQKLIDEDTQLLNKKDDGEPA